MAENKKYVTCETINGKHMTLNAACVEFFIEHENGLHYDGEDYTYLEIQFKSGASVKAMLEVDQDVYPGHNLATLLMDGMFEE